MKKSLIALAVASAVSAPAFAATSNVDVYGVFNMSVNVVDRDQPGVEDEFTVASNRSRLGFKGAEDLGGGLSAIWQLEQRFDADTGAFPTDFRNTFVGLSSKALGTVKFGRYDTAYKMTTAKYDAFADGLGDYNNIMGAVNPLFFGGDGVVFNERADNSISYESPSFMGFTGMLTYGQQNETGLTATNPELWSLGGVYANGPLSVIAAYEINKDTTTNGDAEAWKIGAGYQFGNTRIAGFYERIKFDSATSDYERDAWYVSVVHQMGSIALKAAYAMADEGELNGVNTNDGAQQWTLGVDYSLSKRTTAYALYTSLDNDTNAGFNMGVSSSNSVAPTAGGQNPNGLSIGLKHTF
jgi:predicted porin